MDKQQDAGTSSKLTPGTQVIRSGYDGTVVREYLPDMYEVRLASGVVVVPADELQIPA